MELHPARCCCCGPWDAGAPHRGLAAVIGNPSPRKAMAARDCALCGASVPVENMLTHELMCSRRLGKNVRASTAAAAQAATSPPGDEKSVTKKLRLWAPPAHAEVIELLSDDDTDVDSDGGLIAQEQKQKQKQIAADEALARSLATAGSNEAVQTAWAPQVRTDSGASTSSGVLVAGARAMARDRRLVRDAAPLRVQDLFEWLHVLHVYHGQE